MLISSKHKIQARMLYMASNRLREEVVRWVVSWSSPKGELYNKEEMDNYYVE